MNNWIERFYENEVYKYIDKGKVLVVLGPRRVGKTSLLNRVKRKFKGKIFYGAGDDMVLNQLLNSLDLEKLRQYFQGYDFILIDEAKRVKNIGLALKLMIDNFEKVNIIVSGSSSFKLFSKIGEPLTGRYRLFLLFPVSMLELKNQYGNSHIINNLENFLIYGTYPEVLTCESLKEKKEILVALRDSYLFKDILELDNIRNSDKLGDLLRLLAFQIGKEVSLNELSNNLGLAKQTVARYLDLFEKMFIIRKVRGFSRNLRSEITKTARYYFLDNGIRNSLIMNFNSLSFRDDIGMLWENFLFSERLKYITYKKIFSNIYFWRTHTKKEIDYIEERDGKLFGYEFKWSNKKVKPPSLWEKTYKNSSFEVIDKDNFLTFIT